MPELDGTVALVTGAAGTRSIGRGIALALARRGADVVVNDVAHEDEARRARGRDRGPRPPRGLRAGRRVGPRGVPRAGGRDRPAARPARRVLRQRGRGLLAGARRGDARGLRRHRGRQPARLLLRLPGRGRPDAPPGRRRPDRGHLVGQRRHAVPHPGRVRRHQARGGPPGLGDGPGVGCRRDHGQPRGTRLGATRGSTTPRRTSPARRRGRPPERSIPLGHRSTEPREIGEAVAYFAGPGATHTTGAFLRVDGGMVIGKY